MSELYVLPKVTIIDNIPRPEHPKLRRWVLNSSSWHGNHHTRATNIWLWLDMMVLASDHVIVTDLLGDIFVTMLVAPSEARNDPDCADSFHF